ncbi:MAG: pyridoxamine 5'-phosphate oxidase family protein [Promethearchaeota archaeon]|nr:MAG: pyridoxamine 5'-phosphate oxidase family protein [Candidatus Lokiarchaeota archaeon]
MRRKDKEIKDKKIITSIIQKAKVCRLALSNKNIPYIVPLNYGFQDNCIYFHSAKEGKKIDIIKQNNNVCFEIDLDFKLIPGKKACDFTASYISVVGFGKAEIVDDLEKKRDALNIIMKHYTGKNNYSFNEKSLKNTLIIKIKITDLSGKKS